MTLAGAGAGAGWMQPLGAGAGTEPVADGMHSEDRLAVSEAEAAPPGDQLTGDQLTGDQLRASHAAAGRAAAGRAADLRLARLHLRLGALSLAGAELEAAHAEQALGGGGLLDLAEVRWRTGDLPTAGEAAEEFVGGGGQALIAAIIAAEAAAHAGRPTDAGGWLAEALALAGPSPDDALRDAFAGMPRSAIWPLDPAGPDLPGPLIGDAGGRARAAAGWPVTPRIPSAPASWRSGAGSDAADPIEELAAAGADLEAGETVGAAVRLGIVLRLAPALAPAVLELLQGVPGGLPALIRGDAYRLVGREVEADRAYVEASNHAGRTGTPRDARDRAIGGASSPGAAADDDAATPVPPRQSNQEEIP